MKTTEEVFAEFEELFDPNQTPFKQSMLGGKVVFALDYPTKGLKIMVTTPIKDKMADTYELEKGLTVEFAVYHRETKCLEFRNSRITEGWTEVAKKKIETLIELVSIVPHCPICDSLMYPNKGKDFQVNPRGTEFVWNTCESKKCGNNVPTPFRTATALKTNVARYLKKGF